MWRTAPLLAAAAAFIQPAPLEFDHKLLSADAARTDSADGDSDLLAVSPDGTKVVFSTFADDLGPTDTNNAIDIYMRDVDSETITLVSVNKAGTGAGNGSSNVAVFSPDGSTIAFMSGATDLVEEDDTNSLPDLFAYDVATETTTLISENAAGTATGSGLSFGPHFSGNGRFVAFTSNAGNLTFGHADINSATDVYLRDLVGDTTKLVSVNAAGTASGNAFSGDNLGAGQVTISADGNKVAFQSLAADLGPADTNAGVDIYVRDINQDETSLVSVDHNGASANAISDSPVFSPDGTQVAFDSRASDLVPTDTNNTEDVFLRDLTEPTVSLVSTNQAGLDSGNNSSQRAVFSPDGRSIAFQSRASNLVPGDIIATPDLFLRDIAAGETVALTLKAGGTETAGGVPGDGIALFSSDGTQVAFRSDAATFGPHDTNGDVDLYVRDLADSATTLVSSNADDSDAGNGQVRDARSLAGRGTRFAYSTTSSDLGPTDTNESLDVYAAATADPSPPPTTSTTSTTSTTAPSTTTTARDGTTTTVADGQTPPPPAGPDRPGFLPRTGVDALMLAGIALGLAGAGGALILISRRKRPLGS